MKYSEWLKKVPATLTGDSLWKMEAYRLALFAADVSWHDVTKLTQDKRSPDQQALATVSPTLLENVPVP